MSRSLRRAGVAGPQCLVLAIVLAALSGRSAAVGQEKVQRPTDDLQKLENFRSGNVPVVVENNKTDTEQNRQSLDRVARYYALRLNASTTKNEDYRAIREDAARRMALPKKDNVPPQQNPLQRQFIAEFGKAMISHLDGLALNSAKSIVRLNACMMAADVGKMGYDGAAELYIKILEKEDTSDGYKEWALKGLHNLFAIVPDPVIPEKTVFQQTKSVELSELERRAIQALIKYIERKVEVTEEMKPQEIDALRYVRREAVRTLGLVRVQTVKHLGKVESRPAFVLLKVARNDIPSLWPAVRNADDQPPTEQVDAIIGFCRLKPDIMTRDLNLDYAAYQVGKAIQAIATYRNNHQSDRSMSWKATASLLREALENWWNTSQQLKIRDAKLVKDLIDTCDGQCLLPIENDVEGNKTADLQALTNWLNANQPKSTSLFANDPATALKVP